MKTTDFIPLKLIFKNETGGKCSSRLWFFDADETGRRTDIRMVVLCRPWRPFKKITVDIPLEAAIWLQHELERSGRDWDLTDPVTIPHNYELKKGLFRHCPDFE